MGASQMLIAMKQKYQAEIEMAKNNVNIFVTDPTGVAEHIDYATTVEKELEKIAKYKDLLSAIEDVLKDRHGSGSD